MEHPARSSLWSHLALPRPGARDSFGGYTVEVYQGAYGHDAPKLTWLYIIGARPSDYAAPRTGGFRRPRVVENMSKRGREATPPAFARYLVSIARAARYHGAEARAA